jgi:hypothetical protein
MGSEASKNSQNIRSTHSSHPSALISDILQDNQTNVRLPQGFISFQGMPKPSPKFNQPKEVFLYDSTKVS